MGLRRLYTKVVHFKKTRFSGRLIGISPLLRSLKSMDTQAFFDCDVAVKVASNLQRNEVENLFQELMALKEIGFHKHVTAFLGWSTYRKTPCLAFELAETNLLYFVQAYRNRREEISTTMLVSFLWQVAQGKDYVFFIFSFRDDIHLLKEPNSSRPSCSERAHLLFEHRQNLRLWSLSAHRPKRRLPDLVTSKTPHEMAPNRNAQEPNFLSED